MYMITALVASVVSDLYSNRRFDASVLASSLLFFFFFPPAHKINIIYCVLFLSSGLFIKVFFTLLAEKQECELNKENEHKVEFRYRAARHQMLCCVVAEIQTSPHQQQDPL